MRRQAWLLLIVLLAPSMTLSSATGARSMELDMTIERYDWWSNETIEIDLILRNAPFNQMLNASWILTDEGGQVLTGSSAFQASGTFTTVTIQLEDFYRGHHFQSFSITVFDESNTSLGQGDISFTVFQQVVMPSVGQLLSFGDSLSDMGNAKASFLNTPDVPPYWQGRFSNGEVWLGYLYDAYGLTPSIGSGISSTGDNRAFGGAQTGSGYAYLVIPNVGSQITSYLANVQSTIPSNAVVNLWAGGNDFLYGTANADTIATNMESHIRQLSTAGAQTFVIPNLPPLEDTPEIQSRSSSVQTSIRNEVIDYNSQLASLIVSLRAELGINIYSIDAWTIFGDIMLNKESLGLTNTQDAACSGGSTLLPLPICNSASAVASNVDEYVFFDKAHPTRIMHTFIGAFAIESIGSADTDGDGIVDSFDICPWTDEQETPNAQGCGWSQLDDDNDSVLNGDDICPNTTLDTIVDENGCSSSQRDSDGDGLNDFFDPCPFSPNLWDHDEDGCADVEDLDDDNDGVLDDMDACPQGLIGVHINDLDSDGCADVEDSDIDGDGLDNTNEASVGTDERNPDTDADGSLDGDDAFPLDPTEWADTDRDGCGDNRDVFPFNPEECDDADEDGYGDNQDVFPADETEWFDLDEDGVGDNSDACPFVFGLSVDPQGCPDRDGDGYADTNDAFPNDGDEWSDRDGDGYGDNEDLFPDDEMDWADKDNDSYGDYRDAFPSDPSEWNDTDGEGVGDNADMFPLDPNEWNDSDGDGCGDNQDVYPLNPFECYDSDFDGVGDNEDAFPLSALESKDSDSDGVGDNTDLFPNDPKATIDSDGDGVANAYDAFPKSSLLDSWADVFIRLLGALGLIGGTAWLLRRQTMSNQDTIDLFTQEHAFEFNVSKPLNPPSMDAFSPPPLVPSEIPPLEQSTELIVQTPQENSLPVSVSSNSLNMPENFEADALHCVDSPPPTAEGGWTDLGDNWG
ncbi:MAG: SGNH/GDSL hydrolase family protein [Candidatus Poseidonia sp.]|nr:SGNH/GDSL hydrolase family protein [Poseidonia sp.]